MKLLWLITLLATACQGCAEGVVARGAKLEKLADGFNFTEGPTCDANGNLFFTDQPNDRILKWSTRGRLSTVLQPAGRVNGLCFDAKSNLIACAEAKNELWSIAPDKTVTVLVTNFQSRHLNGPNDVWVAPDGGIFFTDPFYRRAWTDTNLTRVVAQNVFHLTADRQTLKVVAADLKKPNGITGTPDGKALFVSDIRAGQTWRYDILSDGSLTNKALFCAKGSDGMTVDAEGNLYLCPAGMTNGVSVFDRSGKQIDQIDVPEKFTTNVCIGGRGRKTLFITANGSLYAIKLRVKGANPAK